MAVGRDGDRKKVEWEILDRRLKHRLAPFAKPGACPASMNGAIFYARVARSWFPPLVRSTDRFSLWKWCR